MIAVLLFMIVPISVLVWIAVDDMRMYPSDKVRLRRQHEQLDQLADEAKRKMNEAAGQSWRNISRGG